MDGYEQPSTSVSNKPWQPKPKPKRPEHGPFGFFYLECSCTGHWAHATCPNTNGAPASRLSKKAIGEISCERLTATQTQTNPATNHMKHRPGDEHNGHDT